MTPEGIPIERANEVFDVSSMSWDREKTFVPMFELAAEGTTSEEAAQLLVLKENQVFRKSALESKHFTLLLGPESEKEVGGKVVRYSRIGVVRGVLRNKSRELPLTSMKANGQNKARYKRKLPKGVVSESR